MAKVIALVLIALLLSATSAFAATMSDYSATPPVVADSSEPNVLILLSNDWTGFTQGYVSDVSYSKDKTYWGYFDPRYYYKYTTSAGGYFTPVALANSDHTHPGGNYWSGNFLNWVTMANVDFLRKALTGGRRTVDSITQTRLTRGNITTSPWDTKLDDTDNSPDLKYLIPQDIYDEVAGTEFQFHNSGTIMEVQDSGGKAIDNKWTFTVVVDVCVDDPDATPPLTPDTEHCVYYPQNDNWKPQGLLQKYADQMRFGLMSYSQAKKDQGGVLRRNIGSILNEFNWDTNGQERTYKGVIRFINNYSEKGWDPLAEMFYDAIRYYKGNTAASEAYCGSGNFTQDDGYPVYGCEKNQLWEDPVQNYCQSNHIIILNDEYPSRDHDKLPGTTLASSYSVTPAHSEDGANVRHYDVNVADLTNEVGRHEGINGTMRSVGNVKGGMENPGGLEEPDWKPPRDDDDCTPKLVPNLADVYGICPSEGDSERNPNFIDPNNGKVGIQGPLGTFYLAGLAHDAFTTDLRPDITEGFQNVRTWAIAYRATSNADYFEPIPPMNQMWLAAKYGNFEDDNSNGLPDNNEWEDYDRCEWTMEDAETGAEYKVIDDCTEDNVTSPPGDAVKVSPLPKGYFPAENGDELYYALDSAFKSILETTASGTSVSVLSNSGQGEGNLVQAYYRPRISDGSTAVEWLGFIQSLWIDSQGFIREDTNGNQRLDTTEDYVVRYIEEGRDTMARIYPVSDTNEYPDVNQPSDDFPLDQVKVLWDGGDVLRRTAAGNRNIFTFVDKDEDGIVDDTGANPLDGAGEVVRFYDRNYRTLMPYLNVRNDLDDYLGRSQKIRALNLVRWVEGYDPEVNANKFIDLDRVSVRQRSLDNSTVYKLGDIINSTPVTLSAPPDNFHIIYGDPTYEAYAKKYANRETVSYVGANDGMLHAFTSHVYNKNDAEFSKPTAASDNEEIGTELWAYIPHNLLPHLKWLPREDYSHVYYVDMQPRIFDARIFTSELNDTSGKHPNGWGTILVGGFNIGGGRIQVTDFFHDGTTYAYKPKVFKPSFFAIDITDPRNPELLWERTYEGLGMSSVYPTVMRFGANADSGLSTFKNDAGKWFLVFGSGPDAGDRGYNVPQHDGHSESEGFVYVVDVATGDPIKKVDENDSSISYDYFFKTTEDNAFMGPPVSFDANLNYNTEAVYIPLTYDANGNVGNHDWDGGIYKITVPWKGSYSDIDGDGTVEPNEKEVQYGKLSNAGYSLNPADTNDPWSFHKLFDSPRPISAAPSLSIDHKNNAWVYFGTGRMWDGKDDPNADFGSEDTEFLFGIKDPFFDRRYSQTIPMYYLDYNESKTVGTGASAAANPVTTLENDLFNGDPYIILETGEVYEETGGTPTKFGTFEDMVDVARTYDGWFRTLPHENADGTGKATRNLNKPAVLGGLSLFTTFLPSGDQCAFGGSSTLGILYYETGTAFRRPVVRGASAFSSLSYDLDGDGDNDREISDGISLGYGTTSSVGIHIGRQNSRYSSDGSDPEGDMVTGFVQQGTGKVVEIDIETAIKVRSGLRAWKQRD